MKTILKRRIPPLLFRACLKFRHPTAPIPLGLWFVNFIVQRIFRVNNNVSWPVHYTSTVMGAHKIKIGKNVWVSFAVSGGCYIQGGNGIYIGDDTIFAPGVKIISANHNFQDLKEQIKDRPIRIGSRCWIGANVVILPGVEIGDATIIGAGAVVTRDMPSHAIVVGNPATLLRYVN